LTALFKGIIWAIIMNKKINAKFFFKFWALNLIWMIIVCGLMIFLISSIFMKFQPNETNYSISILAMNLYFLLVLYFTTIMYYAFAKTGKIKETIKVLWTIGIKKIHKFVMPAFAIVIIVIILSIILLPLKLLPEIAMSIITAPILLFLIHWIRNYLTNVIEDEKIKL
jgi:hypothetical protein